jgi:hypothetical protein
MNALGSSLRRRWPAYALVASLVLNGFLVGMIAMDSFKPRRGFSGERFAGFELRRLDDHLPREAVDRISAELQPLASDISGRIDSMRERRREIMRLAAEPEPDRSAIDAELAELRTEISAMQEEVQRATYDSLLRLPPEMRRNLAAASAEQ